MTQTRTSKSENLYNVYAGNNELSPFHQCYAHKDTILRFAIGRFFVHDNGEDHESAYWRLKNQVVIYDVPERPVEISGPDVVAFLEMIFARRVSDLNIGRGRYCIACTHQGGIFMDGVLFRMSADRFWYVQPDGALDTWLLAHKGEFEVSVSDPHSRVLQIQGPNSYSLMHDASDGSINKTMKYFHSGFYSIGGQEVYVSRTGWTGELGYEIYTLGNDTDCPRLWDHLMQFGGAYGLEFSGLKSMNARRIEAGILDCGSDFDATMTPYEAGLGRFIELDKQGFIGRESLLDTNTGTCLYGLISKDFTPRRGASRSDLKI